MLRYQIKSAPSKPRCKLQLLSQSGAPPRPQTTLAAKKPATKPPPRSNRAKKPIEPPEIPAEEPPPLEHRISPFGDEFYDENRIGWHPDDEDPELLLDDLEQGLEKGEDDDRSIFGEDSELNYNYIVTFNVLFERTKAISKGSKICARYKDDFEFNSQLRTWSQKTGLYADNIGNEAHLIASVQHPERLVFDLSTLYGLPVSRRCSRQAAKWHRPASIPVLLGGAGTATPGSSPLSMRLGIWSGWVGKHERLQAARKNAACPIPLDEGEKKTRKESADALDVEEYPVPCDGSPMSRPCCRRHPPQSYPCSCRATSTQAKMPIWAATLAPSQAGPNCAASVMRQPKTIWFRLICKFSPRRKQ